MALAVKVSLSMCSEPAYLFAMPFSPDVLLDFHVRICPGKHLKERSGQGQQRTEGHSSSGR